jgi:predicted phage terminase large subunit-like protein
MPIENAKDTIREELITYSTRPKRTWKSVKYKAHNKDFSKILWKDRYDKEWFKAKFEDYSSQGLSDIYAQEFLNEPLDESNAFFKRGDFLPIRKEDQEKKLTFYVAADLAVSQAQRADYTAIVVGGMDESGILHIKNVIRERMDSMEIVNTLLMLHRLYDPHIMAIEEGAISKAIGPFLREQMIATGTFPNVIGLKPSADKITRARSIQARLRAGAVKFDKEQDWYSTLEEEMVRFPRDKHDDQVDAMAYLGSIIDKMVVAPTIEEQEEDDYLLEMQESGNAEEGRNETTGY